MSNPMQTVYFTNPAVITGLQQSVGTTPGQITTNQINLTGALFNINCTQFVDKYTLPRGLGPYQVDCIPIVLKDTFSMPKFSLNSSTTTGTSIGATGGSNNISFTTGTYDTVVAPDIVIFAPSVRTTMETSPLFSSTGVGEPVNLGAFGITLEDWRGALTNYTLDSYLGNFGATGLANKYNNFYNVICASGTTSTGTRQAALDTIRSDPDFTFLKNNMKYPFKKFNQVKSAGEFQFENLLDLNGQPLVNTGAAGNTGYFTQFTSTSYSATGNLLPILQNINANQSSGTMGLIFMHLGTSKSPNFEVYGHEIASLGYIVIVTTHNPVAQVFQKYGSSKSYSQLLVDKTISTISTFNVDGIYQNGGTKYGTTNDNLVPGSGDNGFCRVNTRLNANTEPASIVMERFYYQMKCILQKLGIGSYIDYNNVMVCGESAGGYAINSANRFITTGLSTSYKLNGASVPLFKSKAFINYQCVFFDTSLKLDANNSSNIFNNRYALGISSLKCPFITITGDFDMALPVIEDNRYNIEAQTLYQSLKLENTTTADDLLSQCVVFYKSSVKHSSSPENPFSIDDGKYVTIFEGGFTAGWLDGWKLPIQPQFPSYESIYECDALQNETAYVQLNDLKVFNAMQMMTHRFLGIDYPFSVASIPYLGMKYDIGPTSVENACDYEYTRIGPIAKLSYDTDYNVNLVSYNYQGTAAPQAISFIATGSTGSFRNLYATVDVNAPKATFTNSTITSLTGTTANITTANITTANLTNSTITSLTGTNAAITNSTLTNSTITSLTGTNAAITNSTLTNSTITSLTGTNANITTANITTANLTNSTITSLTGTNAAITNSTLTNSTITSLTGTNAAITNSTLTNSTITSLTGTNAAITSQFTLPVYTVSSKPLTGDTGSIIVISDSTPAGRLAYCFSNTWYYVSDNSAV